MVGSSVDAQSGKSAKARTITHFEDILPWFLEHAQKHSDEKSAKNALVVKECARKVAQTIVIPLLAAYAVQP